MMTKAATSHMPSGQLVRMFFPLMAVVAIAIGIGYQQQKHNEQVSAQANQDVPTHVVARK